MAALPLPLTPKIIEPLMQLITATALGLDITDVKTYSKVRVGWQTDGQPAFDLINNTVFVRCTEEDDEYNRIRDEEQADFGVEPSIQVQLTTKYTRVWRVFWTIYGPDSYDNARIIRSALYTQAIHDLIEYGFSGYGQLGLGQGGYGGDGVPLFLVTDASAPRRVPELKDGRWWERVDFDCQFNEAVTEAVLVNAVSSTEVDLERVQVVPCP